jgi:Zn-dependent protease
MYGLSGKMVFVGAAIWMFLVTLFNLLPIMPLDGGRVVRSVAMSLSSKGGVITFVLGIVIMCLFLKVIGIGLIVFFLIVGGVEIFAELIETDRLKTRLTRNPMVKKDVVIAALSLLAVAGLCVGLMTLLKDIPGADMAMGILRSK